VSRPPIRVQPQHDPACWGCGENPIGLHLPRPAEQGRDAYDAPITFDARHQGGPGIVHGGVVSAALDEAVGLLATWYAFPTVTARIFVRYRRPVPIDTPLRLEARVVGASGRRIRASAALRDGDEVLAEARAAMLRVPLEHFLGTPQGRATARRLYSPPSTS
jgi:acyl-coenzyme A thioesterase PaaI-like protein